MKFHSFKKLLQSYSTWILSTVTVVPVLDDKVEFIHNLLPEEYKHWFIAGLGIIGLVARAIRQPKLEK